jgi:hypothetical protein
MKVKEKQNPSIFLNTYWNLALKSGDLEEKKNLQNLENLGYFFSTKKILRLR